jgi:hypothetical protein
MATQPEFLAVRHKLDSAGFNVPLDATRGELLEVLQDIRRADQQQGEFVDELRDLMESGGRRDDQLFAAWLGTVHVELVKLGNDSLRSTRKKMLAGSMSALRPSLTPDPRLTVGRLDQVGCNRCTADRLAGVAVGR